MKKFNFKSAILGFILGALICSAVGVSAATALKFTLVKTNYKTTIAGKTYSNTKTPILTYGTTNYIPITKAVTDALNINVTANTKARTLLLNTETPTQILYYVESGIEYIEVDGVKYISIGYIVNNGYFYDIVNQVLNIYASKNDKYNNNPLFTNVPYYEVKSDIYIDYNYFTNTMNMKEETSMSEDTEMSAETPTPTSTPEPTATPAPVVSIYNDENGAEITEIDGIKYMSVKAVQKQFKYFAIAPYDNDKKLKIIDCRYPGALVLTSGVTFPIYDIPWTNPLNDNHSQFIKYDYYVNTIMVWLS